jgi:hypothetical protein
MRTTRIVAKRALAEYANSNFTNIVLAKGLKPWQETELSSMIAEMIRSCDRAETPVVLTPEETARREANQRLIDRRKEMRLRAKLRDIHKSTTCVGCYNNRYNFQSGGSPQECATEGTGCWTLTRIKRGICPGRRGY